MPKPSNPVPPTGAIVRLARFVLAHRRLVLVLWILLLLTAIAMLDVDSLNEQPSTATNNHSQQANSLPRQANTG